MIKIEEYMQAYVAQDEKLIAVCATEEEAKSFYGKKHFRVGSYWFVVVCIT
jgi:hypothetical protein